MRTLHSLLLCTLLLPAFTACERKPTAEEIDTARKTEDAQHPPPATPPPKGGEWMFKDRKNKLDEKARH